jgi:hypothetical protein
VKVLFVMCRENTDHLASCLWDGLCEVLGEANVYDAVGHRYLHALEAGEVVHAGDGSADDRFGHTTVLGSISARRLGRVLAPSDTDFNLLVLNAAFLREYDWDWAGRWYDRLAPRARVAYVEGWDGCWEVHPPGRHVDAVFRKEINPDRDYPYDPVYLPFAAPSRWFDRADLAAPRPLDVFYSGTTDSNPVRWEALAGVFGSRRPHAAVVASARLGLPVADYFGHYRRSKLALCPASAEGADALRTYEAVACGAIPLFVGYPPWRRADWFDGTMVFQCGTAAEVAAHIDAALDRDLPAMRRALWEHAWRYHTTAARARTLLERTGVC